MESVSTSAKVYDAMTETLVLMMTFAGTECAKVNLLNALSANPVMLIKVAWMTTR